MKKISRYLCYIILLIIGFFIYSGQVYAEADCNKYACATCTYTSGAFKIVYTLTSDGSGTITGNFENQSSSSNIGANNGISNYDYFKDFNTNVLTCNDVYLTSTMSGGRTIYSIKSEGNYTQKMTLASQTNNDLPIVADTSNYNTCDFTDTLTTNTNATCTVQSSNGNITNVDCGTFKYNAANSDVSGIDFSKTCSSIEVYMYCDNNQGYCTLNKSANFGSTTTGTDTKDNYNSKEYTCSYKGKVNGGSLTISKNNSGWTVNYNGSASTYAYEGSNSFPTSDCEDIFYVTNSGSSKYIAIATDNKYLDYQISTLCNGYGNEVEQFCQNGTCKISNALCGNSSTDDDSTDAAGCPWQLRAVIIFLKKVAFNTVQIFVPILLIVMGTIDLVKAVASSDDKANKEAYSKFIRRCLAAIMVFFVGTIVSIVMNMFSKTDVGEQNDWQTCWQSIK